MKNNLTLNMTNGLNNEFLNNTITNDLKSIENNKPSDPIKDKKNNEMELILQRLNSAQLAEAEVQDNMSYLQKKEYKLEEIKYLSNEIQILSEKYKDKNLKEYETLEIEKKVGELIKTIDEIMNTSTFGTAMLMNEKNITIRKSNEENTTLTSNAIYLCINVNDSINVKNEYFNIQVDIKFILNNPSIIEEKIIKPVDKALEDTVSNQLSIYNEFLDEYSLAINAINDLFKIGVISETMKDVLIKTQESLLFSIGCLRFQTINLSSYNVLDLLK